MIKRFAGCIREYKKNAILSPVFVTFEVLIECLIPLIMASLIDNGIEPGSKSIILKLGFSLLGMALFSLVFGALAGRSAAIAAAGFAKNLRSDMFKKVQGFSFSSIDRFSTASIVTRLTTDVTNIQNAFMMIIRVAVRSPVMLIFSLVMAFEINKRLSLIFLGAIPVLAVGLYIIIFYAHPIFEKVFKTYDKLNNVVQENLRGIRVVKSFVREDYEKEKFGSVSNEIYAHFSKAQKIVAFNMPLMQAVVYVCMLLISWFGAKIIVGSGSTELTTGGLTGLITYMMQMLISLMMLSMVFVMIIISRASAKRVTELLSEETDLRNPENPIYEVGDGSVSFRNVSFGYGKKGDKLCLFDINLDIKSGETVGIIGGTGSSKSTLVSLIPRLYDVAEGSVSVGGADVRRYDMETLRNSVSVVLQKNELFSGTIRDNLRWGNEDATDDEMEYVCRLAQADGFIREMPGGYDTYIEQGGTNVSGGQKQRLCIARALLKKPKILILDDSTSAVDTRTDAQIRKSLSDFMPETTKFIITQRISSVMDADKIIVLESGRISETGTHEELMKKSRIYREVYESQQKGGSENEAE
ncbi:MAG: ABC transporter ATP-binding protein [Oscillospiraceae bacterium]